MKTTTPSPCSSVDVPTEPEAVSEPVPVAPRFLYGVLAVMPWGSIQLVESGQGLRNTDPASIGFMPIFDTWDAADAYRAAGGPRVQRAEIMPFEEDATI